MVEQQGRRLGIMGGTFDPIHYGHLVTAEAARDCFALDEVVFVPSGRPPHKSRSQPCSPEHRAMMTLLAIITNPHFSLSRIEVDREGYSYAIDTIRSFAEQYGPDTEIFFITGADAILEIAGWYQADELFQLASFIAATRPGFDLQGLNRLPEAWRQRIHSFDVPALAISSTDIRRRVAQGVSIRYLLPETVENYIIKEGLYVRQ